MADQIITPEVLRTAADSVCGRRMNFRQGVEALAHHTTLLRAAADRIETLTRERDDLRKQVAAYELWKELQPTPEGKP